MDDRKQLELLIDIHARVKSIEDRLVPMVADHERRLRTLEAARHYVLGAVAVVSAVVTMVFSYLKNLFHQP